MIFTIRLELGAYRAEGKGPHLADALAELLKSTPPGTDARSHAVHEIGVLTGALERVRQAREPGTGGDYLSGLEESLGMGVYE